MEEPASLRTASWGMGSGQRAWRAVAQQLSFWLSHAREPGRGPAHWVAGSAQSPVVRMSLSVWGSFPVTLCVEDTAGGVLQHPSVLCRLTPQWRSVGQQPLMTAGIC